MRIPKEGVHKYIYKPILPQDFEMCQLLLSIYILKIEVLSSFILVQGTYYMKDILVVRGSLKISKHTPL